MPSKPGISKECCDILPRLERVGAFEMKSAPCAAALHLFLAATGVLAKHPKDMDDTEYAERYEKAVVGSYPLHGELITDSNCALNALSDVAYFVNVECEAKYSEEVQRCKAYPELAIRFVAGHPPSLRFVAEPKKLIKLDETHTKVFLRNLLNLKGFTRLFTVNRQIPKGWRLKEHAPEPQPSEPQSSQPDTCGADGNDACEPKNSEQVETQKKKRETAPAKGNRVSRDAVPAMTEEQFAESVPPRIQDALSSLRDRLKDAKFDRSTGSFKLNRKIDPKDIPGYDPIKGKEYSTDIPDKAKAILADDSQSRAQKKMALRKLIRRRDEDTGGEDDISEGSQPSVPPVVGERMSLEDLTARVQALVRDEELSEKKRKSKVRQVFEEWRRRGGNFQEKQPSESDGMKILNDFWAKGGPAGHKHDIEKLMDKIAKLAPESHDEL